MSELTIPYDFRPRDYQLPFLSEVEAAINGRSNKRFFVQVWHRRSGKDKTNIADVVPRRLLHDTSLVKYVYPTLVMGRDNMWDTIGADGKPFLRHIPDEIRKGKPNGTRMTIATKNGSRFQVAGTDNPDSLRGGNARLFVFSEWSEHDPYAFDVIEPIVRENDGIVVFNYTPKGDNHAKSLWEYAENRPDWWRQMLTANDTGIFNKSKLDEILTDTITRFRALGRSEEEAIAFFEQEYMCSFDSPVIGSYYGAAMRTMQEDRRITRVPYDKELPVYTIWDLGVGDSCAIWFVQFVGSEVHCIDYYESSSEGVKHYYEIMQLKPYKYAETFWPHDGAAREFTTGISRAATARELGLEIVILPQAKVEDGINATRAMLMRTWIDNEKCDRGTKALKNYKKEWNDKLKTYSDKPLHDWSSHASDAMRYVEQARQTLGFGSSIVDPVQPQRKVKESFITDNSGQAHIYTLDPNKLSRQREMRMR